MHHNLRKGRPVTYLFLVFLLVSFTHKSFAQSNDFVGSYWHTEMEYAEQMHILKPHRFSWQAVYGAINQDLRGKWKVKNDTLHLIFDPLPGNKHPEDILAVLTDSGDLKTGRGYKNSSQNKTILERFDKTLPPKKASALAKPINYKKLRAEAIKQRKKRQRERQQERKKEKKRYGRYDGYFENSGKTIAISLYGRENQFVAQKTDPGNSGKFVYFTGSFQIKNDTAYATTYPEQDGIKVFGSRSDTVPEGKVKVYVRDLAQKNIKVKIGNTYTSSTFISSEKFTEENDSVSNIQLKKADSLWVAVGPRKPIVYGFGITRMKSNSILVQPNPAQVETWLNHPIYVTKSNEIHGLLSTKNVLKRIPGKRIPSPVAMAPGYPTLKGKTYYPIQRATFFYMKKNY